MPVRRFRSVEDMNREVWRTPGDPMLYRVMASLWAAGARTVPRHFPPGVHRCRSIEDVNAQTQAWAAADFERRRRQRGRTAPGVKPGPF